ncbi:hypothetical protein GCM10009087_42850 [Sphingomonas oligophenolica]|uniref:Uncharacterized protein n=1 Tax=Sphingomonas oligophenolica TaxID=301154 RepID=A0ABU9XZI1_9SPHN
MPTLPDLIAATHSPEAATAFAACTLSPAGRAALAETGIALMERFPPVPRACCAMSAVYAVALRSAVEAPAYLIAGTLYADTVRVFGTARSFPETHMPFLRTDLDWDGHMWVAIGEYIADISLLPTGRSPGAAAALSALVARAFGPGDRLVIGKAADLQRIGLAYVPDYALTPEEVDALARGAEADLPQRG